MKHQVRTRKLGRVKKQRDALLRDLALSLLEYEQIQTTHAKAKELRPMFEKMITKAKVDNLSNRRLLLGRLANNKKLVKKLFEDVAPRFKDRKGGYTRIVKLPPRVSDASPQAIIQLVT